MRGIEESSEKLSFHSFPRRKEFLGTSTEDIVLQLSLISVDNAFRLSVKILSKR